MQNLQCKQGYFTASLVAFMFCMVDLFTNYISDSIKFITLCVYSCVICCAIVVY